MAMFIHLKTPTIELLLNVDHIAIAAATSEENTRVCASDGNAYSVEMPMSVLIEKLNASKDHRGVVVVEIPDGP